ncbi:MAG: nucleotidyltransferase domain-containing protein [Thermoproteaceae archaeon]|nr:nucleotidyltransferase domain-containing protein [Thermoproteaceae archaeon]
MIRVSVSPREVLVGRCYRVSLERLKQFPWSRYVKFAFLFGSAASGAPARDLDVAIPAVDLDTYSELLGELALWLGMSEDYIDLVEVGPETPCPLVLEALGGIPLHVGDWDLVFRLFNVCQDWEIDARKLQLHETLMARWRK